MIKDKNLKAKIAFQEYARIYNYKNSVIGAENVVTRDIPANVFACDVPCGE